MTKAAFLDRLQALYEGPNGAEHYGEDVTIAEHMLQSAEAAAREGAPETLIAAALLHDVGHLLSEGNPDDWHRMHDAAAGAFLEDYFPPTVVEPVRLHVEAKRYLCARDPGYHDRLSHASQVTLKQQGGPMSDCEVSDFEANPHKAAALAVRKWDEGGKEVGRDVRSFADWRRLLEAQMTV
ncbi:HD domain-containing protein [Limibacillus halophilus]|uniref:Putative HD phosphohydrolase n=1 Tax=Limibacillus halophilus TaxID=1579333 RepID=A0A839STI0_9PROT|nr:HD domain-containing protein [Limibacillus halophilus]MBB3065792.1 putative HD phosphohydrolase [Limibacillus halophilus]